MIIVAIATLVLASALISYLGDCANDPVWVQKLTKEV